MIICTFATNCDCCGKLIAHRSQPVLGMLELPDRDPVFGMDLCRDCREVAQDAVQTVLDPIRLAASAGKRAS